MNPSVILVESWFWNNLIFFFLVLSVLLVSYINFKRSPQWPLNLDPVPRSIETHHQIHTLFKKYILLLTERAVVFHRIHWILSHQRSQRLEYTRLVDIRFQTHVNYLFLGVAWFGLSISPQFAILCFMAAVHFHVATLSLHPPFTFLPRGKITLRVHRHHFPKLIRIYQDLFSTLEKTVGTSIPHRAPTLSLNMFDFLPIVWCGVIAGILIGDFQVARYGKLLLDEPLYAPMLLSMPLFFALFPPFFQGWFGLNLAFMAYLSTRIWTPDFTSIFFHYHMRIDESILILIVTNFIFFLVHFLCRCHLSSWAWLTFLFWPLSFLILDPGSFNSLHQVPALFITLSLHLLLIAFQSTIRQILHHHGWIPEPTEKPTHASP